ncbi:MAG: hypothetical protein C0171_03205 [Caldisphaera sp.]|nr:MAG: hypothetical protein C0201_04635 [Caldisphaera sp.]PMP91196.1 MAG: hypothetical protein C0171_03205 [Caldisphaera sp.]
MDKMYGLKLISIIAFSLSIISFILSIIAYIKFNSLAYLGISFFWILLSIISILLGRVSNNKVGR